MPAHRLSAKKRAALQNLKKAAEQRKAKALENNRKEMWDRQNVSSHEGEER